jgi:hypothetical protein
MVRSRPRFAASLAVAGLALSACTNTVTGSGPGAGTGAVSAGGTGTGSGGKGGASSGGSSTGGTGGTTHATGGSSAMSAGGSSGSSGGGSSGSSSSGGDAAYLPAGIRRLTNDEYLASVKALLPGATIPTNVAFPPDSRQDGFTRNRDQRVDPVLVKQLDAAAQAIVDSVKPSFSTLAPCSDPNGSDGCAQSFIAGFGKSAYRRELTSDEASGLLAIYETGVSGGTYADGIALVIRTVLQSAGFLYVTELGDGSAATGESFELTPRELATELSYYLTAQPANGTLLADADAGHVTVADDDASIGVTTPVGTLLDFATPEALGVEARRLIYHGGSAAQSAVVRLLEEWVGVDRIVDTGKDTTAYPNFDDDYRTSLGLETLNFASQVVKTGGGVSDLLGADWTMANAKLAGASYYDLQAFPAGHSALDDFVQVSVASTKRRGILNQGAFLSVYAHASESAPVLRGVAVLKRILCIDPGPPADLSKVKPPDPPNDNETTRQRYDQHAQNSACAGCHAPIDAIGFAFEDFDGAGNYRTSEGSNHLAVDSTTAISADLGLGVSGNFADSGELAVALSQSAEVRTCFARHLFRNAATQSGDGVQASEDAFVAEWGANPDAAAGKFIDSLVAFATSSVFSHRRAP